MSYFSRLTDIVTCNLSEILAREDDPQAAIEQIIGEIEEGLAGARRSVATAEANERRLQNELDEHRAQVDRWTAQARQELAAGREEQARLALVRKRELQDLIAGLEQQHEAAVATREHLTTTLRALEARLAEARRRQAEVGAGGAERPAPGESADQAAASAEDLRAQDIESELAELKRQLGGED